MGRNLEKDAVEMAAKNQRILEKGFEIFAKTGIEKVAMKDVAKAAGIGIASLYRYYSTKQELVLAIGIWAWQQYVAEELGNLSEVTEQTKTGAERVEYFLDAFLDLYQNHQDLLRFNQFFNVYLKSEPIPREKLRPYNVFIGKLEERFALSCRAGQEDGTLRKDYSPEEIFSTMIHLMLAGVTRYAVGLVYSNRATDAEKELEALKNMLMARFCIL